MHHFLIPSQHWLTLIIDSSSLLWPQYRCTLCSHILTVSLVSGRWATLTFFCFFVGVAEPLLILWDIITFLHVTISWYRLLKFISFAEMVVQNTVKHQSYESMHTILDFNFIIDVLYLCKTSTLVLTCAVSLISVFNLSNFKLFSATWNQQCLSLFSLLKLLSLFFFLIVFLFNFIHVIQFYLSHLWYFPYTEIIPSVLLSSFVLINLCVFFTCRHIYHFWLKAAFTRAIGWIIHEKGHFVLLLLLYLYIKMFPNVLAAVFFA